LTTGFAHLQKITLNEGGETGGRLLLDYPGLVGMDLSAKFSKCAKDLFPALETSQGLKVEGLCIKGGDLAFLKGIRMVCQLRGGGVRVGQELVRERNST